MQLENSNDKIKLRIIWIFLAAAIVLNAIGLIVALQRLRDYYLLYGYPQPLYGWVVLWDLVIFLPYIFLLIEVSLFLKKDKRGIGIFVYLLLQIGCSCALSLQFVGYVGMITVIFWIGVIVLFCIDFQRCYFRGMIIPKYLLVFALLSTSYQNGFLFFRMAYYPSVVVLLSVLLSVFAVYLLFDNFSFAPPFQKVDPIKNELELLQKKYELEILSEEEYQQKRQDIISRI